MFSPLIISRLQEMAGITESLTRSEVGFGTELECVFSPLRYIILSNDSLGAAFPSMISLVTQDTGKLYRLKDILAMLATQNLQVKSQEFVEKGVAKLGHKKSAAAQNAVFRLFTLYKSLQKETAEIINTLGESDLTKNEIMLLLTNEVGYLNDASVQARLKNIYGERFESVKQKLILGVEVISEIWSEFNRVHSRLQEHLPEIVDYVGVAQKKNPDAKATQKSLAGLKDFVDSVIKPKMVNIGDDGSLRVSQYLGSVGVTYRDITLEVSLPAISFTPSALSAFKKTIRFFLESGFYTNETCSLHTHISWDNMSEADRAWWFLGYLTARGEQYDNLYSLLNKRESKDDIIFLTDWSRDHEITPLGADEPIDSIDDPKLLDELVNRFGTRRENEFEKYSLVNFHRYGTLEWRGPRGFLDTKPTTSRDLDNFLGKFYSMTDTLKKFVAYKKADLKEIIKHINNSETLIRRYQELAAEFNKIKTQINSDNAESMKGLDKFIERLWNVIGTINYGLNKESVGVPAQVEDGMEQKQITKAEFVQRFTQINKGSRKSKYEADKKLANMMSVLTEFGKDKWGLISMEVIVSILKQDTTALPILSQM